MSGAWGFMSVFKIFLWGYLVGGITLIPTLLALAWFFGTTPVDPARTEPSAETQQEKGDRRTSNVSRKGDDEDDARLGLGLDEEILEKLKGNKHVPDVFAGYFAICREYVPGGVNGKPPDRTTPTGAVVSPESPSVYQSMYRSIFDRNKPTGPTMEASNVKNRKARNVFYVVLRLGHLMLYDNEDQIEVRHVISLAHYKIDIYAGGVNIPEGELWIKRNCIRLLQKSNSDDSSESKAYFVFSDNCSEKEDFYHTMLQAKETHNERMSDKATATPLKFETPDLVKLVQQLHASEENMHTRWINALIGRVFLALYKTSDVKNFIAKKINKKIARVPKPALISSVQLQSVNMGTLPPFITNPKLKELTVDGDLVVEADVTYKGNFRIEISATVRIDLGTRFKAREVTLVLATVLKRLDGHLLIRIKPPPSNRIWLTFETAPRMELSLEPIVSSRQITYGVVLRAIESRIREVVNETLVYPNWDDMPFHDTIQNVLRGGIWEGDNKEILEQQPKIKQDDTALETPLDESAKAVESVENDMAGDLSTTGVSSSTDYSHTDSAASQTRSRSMRSSSSAAHIKVDSANAAAENVQDRESRTPTSIRSLPIKSPMRSPMQFGSKLAAGGSSSSSNEDVRASASENLTETTSSAGDGSTSHSRMRSKELSAEEIAAAAAAAAGAASMTTKKQTLNQSLNSATAAARNWLAAKHSPSTSRGNIPFDPASDSPLQSPGPSTPRSQTEPMGRGQPLPPPGQPLPPPNKGDKRTTWTLPAASTFANLTKRKPVSNAPPSLSEKRSREQVLSPELPDTPSFVTDENEELFRRKSSNTSSITQDKDNAAPNGSRRKSSAASSTHSATAPPLPKRRSRQQSMNLSSHSRRMSRDANTEEDHGESLLVVEAPLTEVSAPNSPMETKTSKELGAQIHDAA